MKHTKFTFFFVACCVSSGRHAFECSSDRIETIPQHSLTEQFWAPRWILAAPCRGVKLKNSFIREPLCLSSEPPSVLHCSLGLQSTDSCIGAPLGTLLFDVRVECPQEDQCYDPGSKIPPILKDLRKILTRTSRKRLQETYKTASKTAYKISCQDVKPRFLPGSSKISQG